MSKLGNAVRALEGSAFGIDGRGEVWVEAEITEREPVELWHLLAAHAAGWRAIEGSRKRLPAHRLKLCGSCEVVVLAAATTKRCRSCRSKRDLTEIRLRWAGDER